MQDKSVLMRLQAILGRDRIKADFPLAPFTTFKMGGPAQYYIEALGEDDIVRSVGVAHALSLPLTILGGASNVVISDKGITGLVIRNKYAKKSIVADNGDYVLIEVGSGFPMTRLAKETAESGFAGVEYHIGLPGTVGGAIYMNSKWTNPVCYVGDAVVSARLIDQSGTIREVDSDYFQFAYDTSILQKTHEIVLSVIFKLKKENAGSLIKRGKEALAYRRLTQPYGVATSGCFFRNIDGQSAGELIDRAGLKGTAVGGAIVSDTHANFILNRDATYDDVKKLVTHVKKTIDEKYNVQLEEEILYL